MKKKGSITVFLALVLVLLFSFVLTTLEAARIAGGRAYVQMLSFMAGDSARALYYYPLFQQYGLLGIVADDTSGYFSEDNIKNAMEEELSYGLTEMKGGLLSFGEPSVSITDIKTMLSDGAESFLLQLKAQAVLEGAESVVSQLFSEKEIGDAAYAGQVYQKQEEAFAQTATVTQEILKLMELADGVVTDEQGLCFDEEGKLKTKEVFIKKPAPLTAEEWSEKYENEEIYQAIKDGFFSPKEHAEQLLLLLQQGAECQAEIRVLNLELAGYKERQEEIAKELLKYPIPERAKALAEEANVLAERRKTATQRRDELVEWLDIAVMDMEERYSVLAKELDQVRPLHSEALDILVGLESKQLGAQLSVKAYEEYLTGIKEELSDELYAVFEQELQRMKLYAGMDEAGYQVSEMRATLEKNLLLLERLSLPAFSSEQLYTLSLSVQRVAKEIGEYSVEGLWFAYGTIVAAPSAQTNVFGMLKEVTTSGVLSLAGLSKEDISGKRVAGQNLPSAGLPKETLQTELMACIEEVSALFREEGVLRLLKEGIEYSLDVLALEWYARTYFGCFGRERSLARVSYEREYLLFGGKSDSENLLSAVLYLVAVRSVFAMTSILKDTVKMGQLETLAVSVAGFTGIPALIAAIKYGLLLLWSIEEAFVEVAALLEGKRVSMINTQGTVAFGEIFLFGRALVEKKAEAWKESLSGLVYEDYLTILSLLQSVEKKAYRSMDLIQENMRCRYNDGFRMKNVVTGFSFQTEVYLAQKIEAGVWAEKAYQILVQEDVAY